MQIKLSELLAVVRGVDDRIVAVEELSEEELRLLHARYLQLARRGERPLPSALEASSATERIDTSVEFHDDGSRVVRQHTARAPHDFIE